MIRVESITINEFRGVRELTLDFGGKNFAVCGPNGTGKSGVVDALEFVLTGDVSRLSGEGRGDISVKLHGPHVDRRNDPAKARVTVKVTIPSLGKTATIERSLVDPKTVIVTPPDPEVLAVIQQIEAHPEVVLSRRELIRYVLAAPGKRAEEVQALLHLDQVEQVRAGLQKIANGCEKQIAPFETIATQAKDSLLKALGIDQLTNEKLLAATNAQRGALGLAVLSELTATTSLKDGMAAQKPGEPQSLIKAQAVADIAAAREALAEIAAEATKQRVAEVTTELQALASDPAVAASVKRESLYQAGVDLIEGESCPLCDNPWAPAKLKEHLQAKIVHLKDISRKRIEAEKKIAPLIASLGKARLTLDALARHAALVKPPVVIKEATAFRGSCATRGTKLLTILPLGETIKTISTLQGIPQAISEEIEQLEKTILLLPDPTKQDGAREWLTVAQERLEVWREAMRKVKSAKAQAQTARQVSNIYAATSDKVLTGIYEDVEKDFVALYAFINRDDEGKFKAKLVPSLGKLGFDVDFYGRGFFPPGAYHSEGHQDGMGICLYLALMRHLQGDGFTFAVLDDVLMSVDAGHRREVCALLKKEFPNTQFVMTTHDPIWLRHMRTEGLITSKNGVQFRSWNIDQGPTRWDARDVWAEIEDYLKADDVRGAASLLRNYLEYESAELCHRLRAPVEFRGDAQYQLGELLPAGVRHLRDLFRRAKRSANSWNKKDVVDEVAAREGSFSKVADGSNAEQWQINTAVHFNSWATLTKEDFAPVVRALRALIEGFACGKPECGSYFRVTPDRETAEFLNCDCGTTNFNLREKAAAKAVAKKAVPDKKKKVIKKLMDGAGEGSVVKV